MSAGIHMEPDSVDIAGDVARKKRRSRADVLDCRQSSHRRTFHGFDHAMQVAQVIGEAQAKLRVLASAASIAQTR